MCSLFKDLLAFDVLISLHLDHLLVVCKAFIPKDIMGQGLTRGSLLVRNIDTRRHFGGDILVRGNIDTKGEKLRLLILEDK